MPRKSKFTTVPGPRKPQQECRFLSALPLELRVNIYELVFSGIVVKPTPHEDQPRAPPLIMTCRQIHAEALKTYWSSAVLEIGYQAHHGKYSSTKKPYLYTYLSNIGSLRQKLIQDIRIVSYYRPCTTPVRESAGLAAQLLDEIASCSSLKRQNMETNLNLLADYVRWTKDPVGDWDKYEKYWSLKMQMRMREVEDVERWVKEAFDVVPDSGKYEFITAQEAAQLEQYRREMQDCCGNWPQKDDDDDDL